MESHPAYPYLESIRTRCWSKSKRVSTEILLNFQRKRVKISITYLFLSSWAGGIQQILQSDWFLERAEFSHPDHHSGRNPSSWSIFVNELAVIVNLSPFSNWSFLGLIEVRSARHKLHACRNWKNSTYCRRSKKINIRSKVPILFFNYRYITAVCLAMLQL